MANQCRCPRCGTPLMLRGGMKGEVEANAKLFFAMYAERTFVCPKCGYQTKSHTMLMK